MPDPTTHTITAVTVGASSASIVAGTFLGIEYIVLGVAFLGGAVAHIWLERMSFKKMLLAIFGSTVIGVVVSHFLFGPIYATVIHFAPWLGEGSVNIVESKIALSFLLSFTAQKTVPRFFKLIEMKEM